MMDTSNWLPCPVDVSDLDFSGDLLQEKWPLLHAGNLEPFPTSPELQEAWRQYHLGNFAQSVKIGLELGGEGLLPAAFSATIYAQYIEKDEKRKIALFKDAMAICKDAEKNNPSANVHYMYAVAMGRYSQFISAVEALAQGYAGKIKEQIEKCLDLASGHAEAHVTYGGWHAGITDQAGSLMAKMVYGATQDAAHDHYEQGIRLAPESVIPYIEYARGLEVMFGKDSGIADNLEQAMPLIAQDAMQRLDQEQAKQQLRQLTA